MLLRMVRDAVAPTNIPSNRKAAKPHTGMMSVQNMYCCEPFITDGSSEKILKNKSPPIA